MLLWSRLIGLFFLCISSVSAASFDPALQTAAYYPSYSQPPSAIVWSKFTHVYYFVFTTTSSPSVISTAGIPDSQIFDFVSRAKAAGKTTSFTVGGYTGSRYFSTHVSTAANRRTFALALRNVQRRYGFDGIDLDWEFPGEQGIGNNIVSPDDTANLGLFLSTLRGAVGTETRLSMAVSVSGLAGSDGNKLTAPGALSAYAAKLDYITLMVYDVVGYYSPTTGPNSPLYDTCSTAYSKFSVDRAVKLYTQLGFTRNHIMIGFPSYSYSYTVSGGLTKRTCPDGSASYLWQERKTSSTCGNYIADGQGQVLYKDMVSKGWFNTGSGFTLYEDQQSMTAYLYNPATDLFVPTETTWSARWKGGYVKNQGLAGVNVFDTFGLSTTPGYDLMLALRNGMMRPPRL